MEKKCTKCGEVKSLDEFSNDKKGKHGKKSKCKDCVGLYYQDNKEHILMLEKEYRNKNKEQKKKTSREYYKKNRKELLIKNKYYQEINNEKIKAYHTKNKERGSFLNKRWREENKQYHKEKKKQYREENKEKENERQNIYIKEKFKTDPLFKLSHNIRTSIRTSLRKNGYAKENKTFNILQCEFSFFMDWLNGVASNGYTYGIGDLHLDHVVPISLSETEEELLLLNHYSNFQLLSAFDNISKGNRTVNPVNLARVLEHHPNPDKIREIHARL
jgi:hypothetical protein